MTETEGDRVTAEGAPQVLVVDDERLIRWSLSAKLRDDGYGVAEAADGRSAVAAVESGPAPDVVLLDYRLPDVEGFQLLATLVSMLPAGRVVLMTAHGAPEVQAGALASGAARVVQKPFVLEEMAVLVSQELAVRRQDPVPGVH